MPPRSKQQQTTKRPPPPPNDDNNNEAAATAEPPRKKPAKKPSVSKITAEVLRRKCAVRDCYCASTGAYFPNPYGSSLSMEDRRREELRYNKWIDFCRQGPDWTPYFVHDHFMEFIGWRHFRPTDISTFKRTRRGKEETCRRLIKDADPCDPTTCTKAQALRERGGEALQQALAERAATTGSGSGAEKKRSYVDVMSIRNHPIAQGPIIRMRAVLNEERKLRRQLEDELMGRQQSGSGNAKQLRSKRSDLQEEKLERQAAEIEELRREKSELEKLVQSYQQQHIGFAQQQQQPVIQHTLMGGGHYAPSGAHLGTDSAAAMLPH